MHLEARGGIVPPPAGVARAGRIPPVPGVHEAAADRPRSAVQILVGAPHREVGAPVVQPERHVARRVRQIEAHHRARPPPRTCQALEIEQLAGVILHAGQQDERDLGTPLHDQRLEVFGPERRLAAPGGDGEQRFRRVEAPAPEVGRHRVAVGRKGAVLDQDLPARAVGPEERDQHQVEIHGERVHRHHLPGRGADQARERLAEPLVIRVPGSPAREVRLHAQPGPVFQLGGDQRAGGPGHGTERIPAEIHQRQPVGAGRQLEFPAAPGQRITGVLLQGPLFPRGIGGGRRSFEGSAHPNSDALRSRNSSAVPCRSRPRTQSSRSVIELMRRPGRASPSGKG